MDDVKCATIGAKKDDCNISFGVVKNNISSSIVRKQMWISRPRSILNTNNDALIVQCEKLSLSARCISSKTEMSLGNVKRN
jgi:hypothetical protein